MRKVILIVDDEVLIRMAIRATLEDEGYEVREAGNVDEALLVIEDGGIAAVLTDIEMPGTLNGLDLARMIRAVYPSTPLIVTSGRTVPKPGELPEHVLMLTKPFSTDQLLLILREMI